MLQAGLHAPALWPGSSSSGVGVYAGVEKEPQKLILNLQPPAMYAFWAVSISAYL